MDGRIPSRRLIQNPVVFQLCFRDSNGNSKSILACSRPAILCPISSGRRSHRLDGKVKEVFMPFQKISIKNFWAIALLGIENIKQINLLTGRNNCGKTSVLEAIFLLAEMSSPLLAVNIHNLRGLTLTNNEDFSYLLHGFDSSGNPAISGKPVFSTKSARYRTIYPTSMAIVE